MILFKNLIILLSIMVFIKCSNDNITNIEFNPTDHPVSKFSKEIVVSIFISEKNSLYSFSDDSTMLSCEGEICNDIYITPEEMNTLIDQLSDTNYFNWEIMTSVTPYPSTDCNLLIRGLSNSLGHHDDYMCTIGRGEKTSKILLKLSESLSGEAQTAFCEIASFYKM